MREIDINIEGFNVNGICVGCLNYKRRMFYDNEVKECFKLLANIDVPDGLAIQVCWECLATVKTISRFQAQILKAFDVLIDYSRQHMFLNCPTEITEHATNRLSTSALVTEELSGDINDTHIEDDKLAIKLEESEAIVDKIETIDVPIEPVKTEIEDYQEAHFEEDLLSQGNLTSDDEVLLSKLKKKKDKKSKKKKRKSSMPNEDNRVSKKGNITEEERNRIIQLYKEKMTPTAIAQELGVARNTVYLWTKRFLKDGCVNRREANPRSGRPRKTSSDQDKTILDKVKEMASIKSISAASNISRHTISRRCKEADIRKPRTKMALTPKIKQFRLSFACNFVNYNFDTVMFVGEKLFEYKHDKIRLVGIYNADNVKLRNYKEKSNCVGYWGCMSIKGPGGLVEIDKPLNTNGYIDMLNKILLPTAKAHFPNQQITFVHEGITLHNSRFVKDFVNENGLNVITMPKNNVDFNPMEKLWGEVASRWDKNNVGDFRKHVIETWESMRGTNICFNSVKGFKQKLQDVISNDGGYV